MKLNLDEIKAQLDATGSAVVTTKAFTEDMEVLKDIDSIKDSLTNVGIRYFSNIFSVNVDIVVEDNYTTLKYLD